MTRASGLITVWLDVDAADEPELHAWYDREHLRQVTALEGFVCARRYRFDTGRLRFLAWYETVDEQVEPGPHFQGIVAHPTAWSLRVRTLYGERRERANLKLVHASGSAPAVDAPLLCLLQSPHPPDAGAGFASWRDAHALPALASLDGVERVRRYVDAAAPARDLIAVEIAHDRVTSSPGWHELVRGARAGSDSRLLVPLRDRPGRLIHPTLTQAQARG